MCACQSPQNRTRRATTEARDKMGDNQDRGGPSARLLAPLRALTFVVERRGGRRSHDANHGTGASAACVSKLQNDHRRRACGQATLRSVLHETCQPSVSRRFRADGVFGTLAHDQFAEGHAIAVTRFGASRVWQKQLSSRVSGVIWWFSVSHAADTRALPHAAGMGSGEERVVRGISCRTGWGGRCPEQVRQTTPGLHLGARGCSVPVSIDDAQGSARRSSLALQATL